MQIRETAICSSKLLAEVNGSFSSESGALTMLLQFAPPLHLETTTLPGWN
jgi:hypothetical protein